ncbi:MAG: hypothetical protein GY938_10380 [Ketobacter sp.]|nr:hypothetical protein [Ketobacter sp.]
MARLKSKLGALTLEGDIETKNIKRALHKKACLTDQISPLEKELTQLKQTKSNTPTHITIADLPQSDKFKAVGGTKKYFIDTIKMIAYRAETAMANILKPHLEKSDMARSLIRQILATDADLLPDEKQGVLIVRLHNLTSPVHNRHALLLCKTLNETETIFPGTKLRLHYELVSNQIPVDQGV